MRYLAATFLWLFALPALAMDANDPAAKARAYAADAMATWATDSVIIAAVMDQNLRHAALTQDDITALDQAWVAELAKPVQPMITSVLRNPPANVLRQQVDQAGGLITEVFVMDALGLNVAASHTTSDYWQGDEAKFTQTFPIGAGAVHVSDVDFDESTQVYQIQVSFTLTDPDDGAVIGAVTVALNAKFL